MIVPVIPPEAKLPTMRPNGQAPDLLSELPPGSEILQVAFVSAAPAGDKAADSKEVLFEFPPSLRRRAVLVKQNPDPQQPIPAPDLLILTVPTIQPFTDNPPAVNTDADELLTQLRRWVETTAAPNHPPSHLMTLQGAQIFWNQGRLAIHAQADRLVAIRTALIEASFYEAELREIERTLGAAWPELEADAPLAFEFDERATGRRKQLLKRFQQVLLMRARLARISPHVHCPHLHPPTLASQVGERFRERTRLVHRHEFLDEQIEVFEKIYELCGQRASDFMQTRSANALEWVIIVLLVTQVLLAGFEILTSLSP